jgi:hypothetical protein
MKRIQLLLLIGLISCSAYCDAIFFPQPYVTFCYSAEFTFSQEKALKPKISRSLWAGAGLVGPFSFISGPTYGLEMAIERRHYFRPDSHKNFFISTYLGTALMSDFKYTNDIGVVPGLKFNHKAPLTKKLFIEPYLGLSLPLMYDFKIKAYLIPQPVITVGTRLCLIKHKTKKYLT